LALDRLTTAPSVPHARVCEIGVYVSATALGCLGAGALHCLVKSALPLAEYGSSVASGIKPSVLTAQIVIATMLAVCSAVFVWTWLKLAHGLQWPAAGEEECGKGSNCPPRRPPESDYVEHARLGSDCAVLATTCMAGAWVGKVQVLGAAVLAGAGGPDNAILNGTVAVGGTVFALIYAILFGNVTYSVCRPWLRERLRETGRSAQEDAGADDERGLLLGAPTDGAVEAPQPPLTPAQLPERGAEDGGAVASGSVGSPVVAESSALGDHPCGPLAQGAATRQEWSAAHGVSAPGGRDPDAAGSGDPQEAPSCGGEVGVEDGAGNTCTDARRSPDATSSHPVGELVEFAAPVAAVVGQLALFEIGIVQTTSWLWGVDLWDLASMRWQDMSGGAALGAGGAVLVAVVTLLGVPFGLLRARAQRLAMVADGRTH